MRIECHPWSFWAHRAPGGVNNRVCNQITPIFNINHHLLFESHLKVTFRWISFLRSSLSNRVFGVVVSLWSPPSPCSERGCTSPGCSQNASPLRVRWLLVLGIESCLHEALYCYFQCQLQRLFHSTTESSIYSLWATWKATRLDRRLPCSSAGGQGQLLNTEKRQWW